LPFLQRYSEYKIYAVFIISWLEQTTNFTVNLINGKQDIL